MATTTQPRPRFNSIQWVVDESGTPRVLWLRVFAFIAFTLAVNYSIALVMDAFIGNVFQWVVPLIMTCGMVAYLILVVELQRHYVLAGRFVLRLGIGAMLCLTLVSACFFSLVGYTIRVNQAGHLANKIQTAELEKLIDGGVVSIGYPTGQGITCMIRRPTFSDADLVSLMELASTRTPGKPQLSLLFLESTSVTDLGVQSLVRCNQLQQLLLPSIELSDESISVLTRLPKLQLLMLDEKKVSRDAIAKIYQAIPRLRINGKSRLDRLK